jgi:hypothetical protein
MSTGYVPANRRSIYVDGTPFARGETGRLQSLDRARGLAIVLMVIDHLAVCLLALGANGTAHDALWAIRLTVTRLSLPLFMICTGVLLVRGLPGRRYWLVVLAALGANYLLIVAPNGVGRPEILAVWVAVMALADLIHRYPVFFACVGVIQTFTWEIGGPWHGYQPGAVCALVAIGYLAGPWCMDWANKLPAFLGSIGRRPLTWYLGHLLALSTLALLVRSA